MGYSTEDIERGLHALALEAGNSVKASALTGIPEATLRDWRRDYHRDKYERIRRQVEDKLDRDLAEEMAGLARQRLKAAGKLGSRIDDLVEHGAPDILKDLANADHNLVKGLGLLTGTNRVIRDKPTQIVEQRNADDLIRKLKAAGIVEGTAEEVATPGLPGAPQDAQVV